MPLWAEGKLSWLIHVSLRITTNNIHQYLINVHHRLSFHTFTWCTHLPRPPQGVLWYCRLVALSTLAHHAALFQGLTADTGNFTPLWLPTCSIPVLSIWQDPKRYPTPTFPWYISHWCKYLKHFNLGLCWQVMRWAHIWWWFWPFCLQPIWWFWSWKAVSTLHLGVYLWSFWDTPYQFISTSSSELFLYMCLTFLSASAFSSVSTFTSTYLCVSVSICIFVSLCRFVYAYVSICVFVFVFLFVDVFIFVYIFVLVLVYMPVWVCVCVCFCFCVCIYVHVYISVSISVSVSVSVSVSKYCCS